MLFTSVKEGETVKIGDTEVTILKVRGGDVRMGFTAPPEVRILRGELAAKTPPPSA